MPTKMYAVKTLLQHRPVARNKDGKKKRPRTKGEYEYLVRRDGIDPKTGKPWPDTWEPTEHIGLVTLESYYAAQLARRPPSRPKGARLSKRRPYDWPPQSDAAIFAFPCEVTTPSPPGRECYTLAPLSDTATPSPLCGSSPSVLASAIRCIEKRKGQWDSPNQLNAHVDATSTPVVADNQSMRSQTKLPPTTWRPLSRLHGKVSRLPRVNKRRHSASARLVTLSPFSSSTTEYTAKPTAVTTPPSYLNGDACYYERAPLKRRHGLVDGSPATTPLKKRRRLCDSTNV